MLFTYFPSNYSGTFLVPPAAAGEEQEKEARTPRAPAGGRSPPAPPAEELLSQYIRGKQGKVLESLCLRLRSGLELKANRRAFEAESLAQLIFQVALIAKVYSLGVIDEKDGGGWVHSYLGGIKYLQGFATNSCRPVAANSILHNLVEARGRHAQETHIRDVERRFKQRLHMIASFRRGKKDGRIRDELQAFGNDFAVAFGAFDLLLGIWQMSFASSTPLSLGQVPLVDHNYDTLGPLVTLTSSMGILRCQAFGRVDQYQRHVTAFNRAAGAYDAIFFDARDNMSPAANAGGIDEHQFPAFELHFGIDSIPCRARDLADNRARDTDECIEQR